MLDEVDLTGMSESRETLLDIRAICIDYLWWEWEAIWSKESLIVDLDLPLWFIFALLLPFSWVLIHYWLTIIIIRAETQVRPVIRCHILIVISSGGFTLIRSLERRVSITELAVTLCRVQLLWFRLRRPSPAGIEWCNRWALIVVQTSLTQESDEFFLLDNLLI